MKPAVFFDIDGTLVRCQTQQILTQEMVRLKLLPPAETAKIYLWFLMFRLGWVRNSLKIRRDVYHIFSRYPKKEVDQIFASVCDEILAGYQRGLMKTAVDRHRRDGHYLFALSGSLSPLCSPICNALQIEDCFATRLSVSNDRYSGRWKGDILEGKAKVRLMEDLARQYGFELAQSWAYADSISDLPMLEAVGHPVAVAPDRCLKRHALRHQWTVLEDGSCGP